jgi:hypothetical protein
VYASHRRRRHQQRRFLALGFFLVLLALAVFGLLRLLGDPPFGGQEPEPAGAEEEVARVTTPETTGGEGPEPPGDADGEARDEAAGEKPEAVKGIYLTAYSASGNLDAYLDFVDRTELNAVVVDVKDVTGEVMYPSDVPLAREIGATRNVLPDLEALAAELEERGVYSIARVATFEDDILPRARPDLAVLDSTTGAPWLNNAGQSWSNAYNREAWEYNVAIAREAAEAGFDEVQFDYVRFPSDGPMETVEYGEETYPSQGEALAAFLKYASGELEPTGARVAADVFGLAATEDGAGVGQFIDELAPHVDVLCPMVYPSHFPVGSYGYDDPNARPYEMVKYAMEDFNKEAKAENPDVEIRPWLQDFDLGEPPYGPAEIRAQFKATYDSDATGWLLWNPSNVYTEEALKPAR